MFYIPFYRDNLSQLSYLQPFDHDPVKENDRELLHALASLAAWSPLTKPRPYLLCCYHRVQSAETKVSSNLTARAKGQLGTNAGGQQQTGSQ